MVRYLVPTRWQLARDFVTCLCLGGSLVLLEWGMLASLIP